jgi:hypothetical protein
VVLRGKYPQMRFVRCRRRALPRSDGSCPPPPPLDSPSTPFFTPHPPPSTPHPPSAAAGASRSRAAKRFCSRAREGAQAVMHCPHDRWALISLVNELQNIVCARNPTAHHWKSLVQQWRQSENGTSNRSSVILSRRFFPRKRRWTTAFEFRT